MQAVIDGARGVNPELQSFVAFSVRQGTSLQGNH
jgi:hypothetical protein